MPETLLASEQYVVDVEPVPPLATGNVPETLLVSEQYVVDVEPVPPLATGRVPLTLVESEQYVVDVEPVPPLAVDNVPVMPVASGSPVAFVNVSAVGVPKFGVVNAGLVASTTAPLPVLVVVPVPPLAIGNVPVTPVVSGKPIAFVSVNADGVPRFGVVSTGEDNVGELERTTFPVPVLVVTPVPPLATGSVPLKPTVIEPVPLVTAILDPAVNVALVSVLPVVLPISN